LKEYGQSTTGKNKKDALDAIKLLQCIQQKTPQEKATLVKNLVQRYENSQGKANKSSIKRELKEFIKGIWRSGLLPTEQWGELIVILRTEEYISRLKKIIGYEITDVSGEPTLQTLDSMHGDNPDDCSDASDQEQDCDTFTREDLVYLLETEKNPERIRYALQHTTMDHDIDDAILMRAVKRLPLEENLLNHLASICSPEQPEGMFREIVMDGLKAVYGTAYKLPEYLLNADNQAIMLYLRREVKDFADVQSGNVITENSNILHQCKEIAKLSQIRAGLAFLARTNNKGKKYNLIRQLLEFLKEIGFFVANNVTDEAYAIATNAIDDTEKDQWGTYKVEKLRWIFGLISAEDAANFACKFTVVGNRSDYVKSQICKVRHYFRCLGFADNFIETHDEVGRQLEL